MTCPKRNDWSSNKLAINCSCHSFTAGRNNPRFKYLMLFYAYLPKGKVLSLFLLYLLYIFFFLFSNKSSKDGIFIHVYVPNKSFRTAALIGSSGQSGHIRGVLDYIAFKRWFVCHFLCEIGVPIPATCLV